MNRIRHTLEMTIERLVQLLDEIDGDADFEPEVLEEQYDREADPAEDGLADRASLSVVIAAQALRKRRTAQ